MLRAFTNAAERRTNRFAFVELDADFLELLYAWKGRNPFSAADARYYDVKVRRIFSPQSSGRSEAKD